MFRLRLLLAFALLSTALAWPARAQVEVAPGVVHDSWGTADGLPVNSVNGIAQTPDGYLWLATFDGLVRFDGARFTVFTSRTTPALTSNRFNDVAVDADGSLWAIQDEEGGIVRYRDGQFDAVHVSTSGSVDMREFYAHSGRLRIGGRYGAWEIDGGEVRPIWRSDQRANDVVRAYDGASGVRWVQQGEGYDLLRISGRDTLRFGPDVVATVLHVYPDPSQPSVAWINSTRGNFRFAGGRLEEIERVDRPDGGDFAEGHYFRDRSGRLLLGTDGALYSVDERTGRSRGSLVLRERSIGEWWALNWKSLPAPGADEWIVGGSTVLLDGRPVLSLLSDAAYVTSSLVDSEGNLWVGTVREGLHRLRPSVFTTYAVEDGLLVPNVYAVAEAPDRAMWFGTLGGGASRLHQGRVQSWQRPDVPSLVYDVLPLVDGSLLAGGGGLARTSSFGVPSFNGFEASLSPETASPGIRAMHQSADGCVWFGAETGLFRQCDGTRERLDLPGAPARTVRAFLPTRDGALWMATAGGGLSVFRGSAFDSVTTADGLSSDRIRGLYEDREGVLWVATEDAGLNRVARSPSGRVTGVTVTDEGDGLFDDALHAILEDDDGRFWMSTNRGIFWVRRGDLEAFAQGASDRVFSVSYDESAGLRDREANGGAGSSATRASDGRLWFATQGGAVVVDPRRVDDSGELVRSVVESISADTFSAAVARPSGQALRLPMGARDVTIAYTGLFFTRPQALRFRYRLLPTDGWTEAGARREAIFTDLRPGTYAFEVIASAYPGRWPERGDTLAFVVPAAFYETAAFRIAGLLGLLLLAVAWVRWRSGGARRRESELRRQVQARTADVQAQQQRAEAALETVAGQAQRLAQLDEAKSRFFANISHEFRTPLTLTLGPLEDLRDGLFGDVKSLSVEADEQVRLAHRNAQRLLRLTNQMLVLSRLESGAVEIEPAPVDLGALLGGIVHAFSLGAERKGLALTLDAPAAPAYALGDADRLDEVFVNLVGNAFKFTPQGGRVRVSVYPQAPDLASGEQPAWTVEVRDSGVGIDPAEQQRVFERFYQGSRQHDPSIPGTGIGLALARELVLLHGGTIRVESVPGQGSAFFVTLPAAEPMADDRPASPTLTLDAAAMEAEAPPPDSDEDDQTTVLVADDHADIRAYVRRHLEPAYRVIEACDGREALSLARHRLPDLIVSDVMMPHMDGLELCRALKSDPATAFLPVVLLTGKAGKGSRLEGLGVGADDYLAKPVDPAELRARIDNLIAGRQRLRELVAAERPAAKAPAQTAETVAGSGDEDGADEPFVASVRAAIGEHLADSDFGVEALALELGVSRTQLYRRLKSAGHTATDLLRHARLERAADLLMRESGTVGEVAYGVGFNSVAHFSRSFRAAYGVPPSAYRADQAEQ